jgi:hypothetical protein
MSEYIVDEKNDGGEVIAMMSFSADPLNSADSRSREWAISTPLGDPVVPEVKHSNAAESGSVLTIGRSRCG